MKIRNLVFGMLVSVLAIACEEEEPPKEYIMEVRVLGIGTKVEFYDSEENFWLRSNAAFTKVVDEQFLDDNLGLDPSYIHVDKNPFNYWVYASNGNLNNIRKGNSYNVTGIHNGVYEKFVMPSFVEGIVPLLIQCGIGLAQTPTRLQIQVLNNGLGIEGAEVQLYFSEQAYIDDLPAHQELDILEESYAIGPFSTEGDKEIFNQTTDSEGYVLFDDLEPKQYWFRITKDGLTNDAGTINLSEALPDDMNITTSITVGIN